MYLLDTNTCIYIINKRPHWLVSRIDILEPPDVKISSITLGELEYGAAKSNYYEKNRKALIDFISPFEIIYFDVQDAEIYGIIRAELERKGEVIGPYDMQLAAQALNRNYTLVTNNTREFQRIKMLKLENWLQ
jgi:tRNA(fMet)-specific endonuclease VapC